MRKFEFNLQRLLDYKRTIEDTLLAELAGIRAEHARERTKLLDLIRDRDTFSRKMKEKPPQDAERLKRSGDYLNDLSDRISAQEVALRRIAERKDQKTAEVLEASKERKALERLRELKQGEYTKEAQRVDQVFLDELASMKSNRERCEAGRAA